MLSEGSFIVNHWITILWLVAAGLYTSYAVIADICRAAKTPVDRTEEH